MTNTNERPKRERTEDCVSGLQGPTIRSDDINRHDRRSEVRSRQFMSSPPTQRDCEFLKAPRRAATS